MDYVTIDFEASCLPRHGLSFPIEVGLCGPEGVVSWLIKPDPAWADWSWTEEAAGLHRITREELERNGLPPAQVFAELLQHLDGRRVVADSTLDSYWWNTLAGAAGFDCPSPILHVGEILDALRAQPADIMAAQAHADELCPARHRAGQDALWLWTLLRKLEQIAADREALSADWHGQTPPSRGPAMLPASL